jgi:hypothetical protein
VDVVDDSPKPISFSGRDFDLPSFSFGKFLTEIKSSSTTAGGAPLFFGPVFWSITTGAGQQGQLVEVIPGSTPFAGKSPPKRVNAHDQGPAKVEFSGCDRSTFAGGSIIVINRQPMVSQKQHVVDSSSLAGTN